MEDIDGGLHPAVDGQSLDEDEDELLSLQFFPFKLSYTTQTSASISAAKTKLRIIGRKSSRPDYEAQEVRVLA